MTERLFQQQVCDLADLHVEVREGCAVEVERDAWGNTVREEVAC